MIKQAYFRGLRKMASAQWQRAQMHQDLNALVNQQQQLTAGVIQGQATAQEVAALQQKGNTQQTKARAGTNLGRRRSYATGKQKALDTIQGETINPLLVALAGIGLGIGGGLLVGHKFGHKMFGEDRTTNYILSAGAGMSYGLAGALAAAALARPIAQRAAARATPRTRQQQNSSNNLRTLKAYMIPGYARYAGILDQRSAAPLAAQQLKLRD